MAAGWTQTDVDNLKAALAGGLLSVEFSGPPARRVTYQSLAEMRKLLSEMIAEVSAVASRPAYRLFTTKKGV